ncbi:hypothetical protein GF312_09640 [Candidatus Poribacteria bacterium]|nr:hypothetical protein [Candidatus Poribacteria bacterium]
MKTQIIIILTILILSINAYSQEFSIVLVGDMMFGTEIARFVNRECSLAPFGDAVELLESGDVTFGSVEGAITTRGQRAEDEEYTFRSRPSAARGLANVGFDVISLANPHILDYGSQGLADTLEFLAWYGIKPVGAGMNWIEAKKPAILQVGDIKIAFIAYYRGGQFDEIFAKGNKPGAAFPAIGELENDVAKAKENADLVIVSMHWGFKLENSEPTSRQVLYAHKLIDAGADAVIGQRLHQLQGIEIYKGKPIIYSLGDFIYGTYAKKLPLAFVVKVKFSEMKPSYVEIIPFANSDTKNQDYFPRTLKDEAAIKALDTIAELCIPLGTDIQMEDSTVIIKIVSEQSTKENAK